MIKLSLPPIPGTDTAHPAFKIAGGHAVWSPTNNGVFTPIADTWNSPAFPVAAAAIAHCWTQSINDNMSEIERSHAEDMADNWTLIAAGSRDFDGAEIVGYMPHG